MTSGDTDVDVLDHPPSFSQPDPQEVQTRTRVLVIDDEPEMLEMLEDTLLPAGFDVVVTASGSHGTHLYRAGRIHLVVLDLFMPGKDGLETLIEIRRCSPAAKVVAISGGGGLRLMQALSWAEKLGASAVLPKPF